MLKGTQELQRERYPFQRDQREHREGRGLVGWGGRGGRLEVDCM